MDCSIEEESVRAAIPREVDEAYQTLLMVGADVAEAAVQNRLKVSQRVLGPRRIEELV